LGRILGGKWWYMHVHAGGMEHMGELRFFERFDITLQLSSTIFNYLQLSSTIFNYLQPVGLQIKRKVLEL
jgi:hypothetical protein